MERKTGLTDEDCGFEKSRIKSQIFTRIITNIIIIFVSNYSCIFGNEFVINISDYYLYRRRVKGQPGTGRYRRGYL